MDNYHKIVFIFLLLFSSTSYSISSVPLTEYALFERFKARNVSPLFKPTGQSAFNSTINAIVNVQGRTRNSALYGKVKVSIPKSTLGKVLKSRMFSPWGIALTAAMVAADYIVDQNTGEVSGSSSPDLTDGLCYGGIYFSAVSSTLSGCQSMGNAIYGTGLLHTITPSQINYYVPPSNNIRYWWVAPSGTDYQAVHDTTVSSTLSDDQIFDVFADTLSPSQLTQPLVDPETGILDAQLPSVHIAADSMSDSYDAEHDSDPATTSIIDNSTGNSITENVTTTNNTSQPSDQSETDTCKNNPDILGCIKLGTPLTAENLTTINPSYSYSPISLTGNATCPSAPTAVTSKGTFTINNQLVCDFATGVSPVIIAICSFLSIYILVGGIRNG